MGPISIAGQIALRLEAVLARAGRTQGLASMPSAGATCFFEDPLGAWLGDKAPRCAPLPGSVERQPLWTAMAGGSCRAIGSDRELHFYEIVGNGEGRTRDERLRFRLRAAQWAFLLWLHWYQRPVERYAHFRRVVLLKTVGQYAPSRRIWDGYLQTMRDLAAVMGGPDRHEPVPPALPSAGAPFQHRFEREPRWVDALGRLATRSETAAQQMTAAQLLGAEDGALPGADWAWGAAPAVMPNTITVNAKRCAPSAFQTLSQALQLDRWLAVDGRVELEPPAQGLLPPRHPGAAEMNAIEARELLLRDMSHRMSLPHAPLGGNMRFASASPPAMPAAGSNAPAPSQDPVLQPSLAAPRWDPDLRVHSRELDPASPELLPVSVDHRAFEEQMAEPDLGVLVHVEVKQGGTIHRTFALAHGYEPPEAGVARGRGRFWLEVDGAAGLPFFGEAADRAMGRWTWEADAGLVPQTGEPVMLLRINVRGQG